MPTGLTFVDDGTATVAFVSDSNSIFSSTLAGAGLASSNFGIVPTFALMDTAISASAMVHSDLFAPGAAVYFKLGDMLNSDNDTNAEYVIVEFNALVNNNSASAATRNDAGDMVYNDAQVYRGAELLYDLPDALRPVIAIVEPSITVNKTSTTTTGDGGDLVTYTISFSPQSDLNSSDAFNVRLRDTLPTGMTLGMISSITLDGMVVSPVNVSSGNTIELLFGRINEGQVVEVVFTATIDASVNPSQLLVNNADVTWSGLSGNFGTSKFDAANTTGSDLATLNGLNTNNGNGETAGTIYLTASGASSGQRDSSSGLAGEPNDYTARDGHTISVKAVTSISKSLISSEIINASNGLIDVVIGELVTYEIVVRVPEATIPQATTVDTLDSGLAFVGMLSSSSDEIGFTGTLLPSISNNGRTITWNLGTITDPNVSNGTEGTITLRYQAVILNVSTNQATTPLDNSATFTWNNDPATAITDDAEDVIVHEPVVTVTQNMSVDGVVNQSSGDAGDAIRYLYTLQNTGPVDAFDIIYSNPLPRLSDGSSAILGPTFQVFDSLGLLNAADFALVGSDATGYTLALRSTTNLDLLKVDTGRTITITVDGTIALAVSPNQALSNVANVAWTSLDGDIATRSAFTTSDDSERDGTNAGVNTADYVQSATRTFTVAPPIFSKSLVGTDRVETSGSNITIGEVVTYAIFVSMPEGIAAGLSIVDQLPAGLAMVGYSIVTSAALSVGLLTADYNGLFSGPVLVSGGNGNGVDATFSFGAITTAMDGNSSNNAFVIMIQAVVLDVATNIGYGPSPTTLANTATLDVMGDAVGAVTSNAVNVRVVESNLSINKNIVAPLANARDTLTIQLTVTNNGLGNAYDVNLEDIFVASDHDLTSVTVGLQGNDYPASFTATYDVLTGRLQYSGGTIAAGDTVGFTFRATLKSDVATDAVLINTAAITQATTLQGAVAGERNDVDPDNDGSNIGRDSIRIREHSLSGFVYHDADNDGLWDSTESGIANVSIHLEGVDHLGNQVDRTVLTTASGQFIFEDLRPGSYSLTEIQPTLASNGKSYLDGLDSVGNVGGSSTSNDVLATISLPTDAEYDGVNYNFGELEEGEIHGYVWHDANNNGLFESSESGIAGVMVTLSGFDDLGAVVPVSVLTSVDGSYSFVGLRPGTYTLLQSEPNFAAASGRNFTDGRDADGSLSNGDMLLNDTISSIEIVSSSTGNAYNFGELVESVLSGYVYHDVNNDGLRQGEDGIGGVTITLKGIGDLGQLVTLTTTSSTSGNTGYYEFINLRPSNGAGYTITQSATPAGYLDGRDTPGLLGGAVSGSAGTDELSAIVVRSDNQGAENNFGELLPSSLSGTVFNDKNNNGLVDGLDYGIAYVIVQLSGLDDLGQLVALSTVTDASGQYSFTNLRPSSAAGYTIREIQPADYNEGLHSDGSIGAGDTSVINTLSHIVLPQGTGATGYDFGERGIGIGGTVFVDDNRDGILGGVEATGIGGVLIQLFDVTGTTLIATALTANDGSYLFTDLPGGDYRVVQVQPGQYSSTTTNTLAVTLPLSGIMQQNFGEALWDIGDTVYYDLNGNGAQDAGEQGIANVEVTLIYAGPDGTFGNGNEITRTTTTDASGGYSFTELFNGQYRIVTTAATLPTGLSGTQASDGSTLLINGPTGFAVRDSDRTDIDFGYTGLPDYAITKTTSLTKTVQGGDVISYEIHVTNIGRRDGTGVIVTDTLPMDVLNALSVQTSAPGDTTFDESTGVIAWNIGTLAVGSDAVLTVTVQVAMIPKNLFANEIVNRVVVTDNGFSGIDPNLSNNSAEVSNDLLIFAYDSFHNFSLVPNGSQIGTLYGPWNIDRVLQPLPVDPIFSGLAEPGATLSLRVYDELGRLTGERQVVADTAGNWLASFPGMVIWKQPHRMEVEQVAAIQTLSEESGYNLRRYFHPATHHSLFFSERPSVASATRETTYHVVQAMLDANEHPLQVGWRVHLYQMNVASSNAAGH